MSDIVIVSQHDFRYQDADFGRVPAGTPLDDDLEMTDNVTMEGLIGVPAVDWSHASADFQDEVVPAKRGPGRPRKESPVEA